MVTTLLTLCLLLAAMIYGGFEWQAVYRGHRIARLKCRQLVRGIGSLLRRHREDRITVLSTQERLGYLPATMHPEDYPAVMGAATARKR